MLRKSLTEDPAVTAAHQCHLCALVLLVPSCRLALGLSFEPSVVTLVTFSRALLTCANPGLAPALAQLSLTAPRPALTFIYITR